MLTGVGIGMFAYASIKKEYITNKSAFFFLITCPVLIFISQIYYASVNIYPVAVALNAATLLLFVIYSALILFEMHNQLHHNKIDINSREY